MARLARVLVAAAGPPNFDEFLRCRLVVGRHLGGSRIAHDITRETFSLRPARRFRLFPDVDQGRHRFGSRGWACDRLVERRTEAKSSPEQPASDVMAPVTVKPKPSVAPAGLGCLPPERHASAGRMRSASRSKMSTRTARPPQTR